MSTCILCIFSFVGQSSLINIIFEWHIHLWFHCQYSLLPQVVRPFCKIQIIQKLWPKRQINMKPFVRSQPDIQPTIIDPFLCFFSPSSPIQVTLVNVVNENSQERMKSNNIVFYSTPMVHPMRRVVATSKDARRVKTTKGSEVPLLFKLSTSEVPLLFKLSTSEVPLLLKLSSSTVIVGRL